MFKIGDTVTVPAGTMKRREGVLTSIDGVLGFGYVRFDNGTSSAAYNLDDISLPRCETTTSLHTVPKISPDTVSYVSQIQENVATKHDDGKNRMELIPVAGIEAAGRAFTFGAKKYADHNWANGFDQSRLIGASLRHITAYMRGQDLDSESGLSHIDHALACLMMLAAHITEGLGNDDRRKTEY